MSGLEFEKYFCAEPTCGELDIVATMAVKYLYVSACVGASKFSYNFRMHRRIFTLLSINVYHVETMCHM